MWLNSKSSGYKKQEPRIARLVRLAYGDYFVPSSSFKLFSPKSREIMKITSPTTTKARLPPILASCLSTWYLLVLNRTI